LAPCPGLKPSHAKTINLSNKITRVLSRQGNIKNVTATASISYTATSFRQSRNSHKPRIAIKNVCSQVPLHLSSVIIFRRTEWNKKLRNISEQSGPFRDTRCRQNNGYLPTAASWQDSNDS